jgi:hypothetical protein
LASGAFLWIRNPTLLMHDVVCRLLLCLGTIAPRNQSSAIAPLLLTVLAGRALDDDGNFTAQTGVASNGFGLVGRVVGVAAGNRNLAAGIGYYAAALSFYENFLHPGRDVVFPRNTRIEIETNPLRAPVLTPKGQ